MSGKNPVDRDKLMAQRIALTAFIVMALMCIVWSVGGEGVPTVKAIVWHKPMMDKDGNVVMITYKKSDHSVVTKPVQVSPPAKAAPDSIKFDSTFDISLDSAAASLVDTAEAIPPPLNEMEEETFTKPAFEEIFSFPLPFPITRWLDPIFAALFTWLLTIGFNYRNIKWRDALALGLTIVMMVGLISGFAWGFVVALALSCLLLIALTISGGIFLILSKLFTFFLTWVTAAQYRTEEDKATNLRDMVHAEKR